MRRIPDAITGLLVVLACIGSVNAQQQGHRGQPRQSVEALERVPQEQRSEGQQLALGQAYYAAGRLDEASKAADAAVKRNPNTAEAWRIRGDVARERGDWQGALKAYERGLRSDPRRPEFELLRGQALMALGRERGADQAFARYRLLQQVQYAPTDEQN